MALSSYRPRALFKRCGFFNLSASYGDETKRRRTTRKRASSRQSLNVLTSPSPSPSRCSKSPVLVRPQLSSSRTFFHDLGLDVDPPVRSHRSNRRMKVSASSSRKHWHRPACDCASIALGEPGPNQHEGLANIAFSSQKSLGLGDGVAYFAHFLGCLVCSCNVPFDKIYC